MNFATCAIAENGFSRFTQKRKVVELNNVISAQINLHILVILSPQTSLYDLQKLSYEFCDVIAIAENGFSRFTQKRKVIELNNVISAQINLHIAVILSPKTSLYDLQKLNYDFRQSRSPKTVFRVLCKNGRS